MVLARRAFSKTGLDLYRSRCISCHELGGSGPDLHGVTGRSVASASGYRYSSALRGVGGRWTPERLDGFLKDPAVFAPGNPMGAWGVADDDDRRMLITYLAALR